MLAGYHSNPEIFSDLNILPYSTCHQINLHRSSDIIYHTKLIPIILTVAKIDATPNLTTTVSILLVSVDNSNMHIYNSLKTQRNNRVTP